jgi:microcystin degradation protein MlrC
MYVEGHEDIEAELLRRVRAAIGLNVVVLAHRNLDGNVSCELAHHTYLITCYRMTLHEHALGTKERACRNLVDFLVEEPMRMQPVALPI